MMRSLFVAGTHTDIGKTHVACALIGGGRRRGLRMNALKPVVSGIDPGDLQASDPGRLLDALGRPLTSETLDAISPLRFAAPLSPPMAARREGRALVVDDLISPCRAAMEKDDHDLLLIEGVGGLMSPITDEATGLDLMTALAIPAVLVSGAYLGAISHALTALVTAKAARIDIQALVVSQSADPDAPDFRETVADLRRLSGGVATVAAPRGDDHSWADGILDLLS